MAIELRSQRCRGMADEFSTSRPLPVPIAGGRPVCLTIILLQRAHGSLHLTQSFGKDSVSLVSGGGPRPEAVAQLGFLARDDTEGSCR